MDFASEHIYMNPNAEYEHISDDEFDRGMSVSDSNSSADEGTPPLPPRERGDNPNKKSLRSNRPKHHSHWKAEDRAGLGFGSAVKTKRWFRRADTNVVSVNFKTLLSSGDMHAGDPVSCQKCEAILSHISKPSGEGEAKMWQCEFCGESRTVDIEDEEIPATEDVTYLLQPAMTTSHSSMSGIDQSLVIFCVDTSGSMCVTSEINGKVKLRGTSTLKRLQSFNETHENQWLPYQRRDVTYVSRLQAMQAAVDFQLGEMLKSFPHRRVALIAFSNEVCVVGDGSQTEVTIAGDKLTSEDKLTEEGHALSLPNGVKDSRTRLADRVYKLEEGGATALGPALVVALSMASHQPGSKVIVCTDGKANIGLGKMEDDRDEESANEFYTNIGDKAVKAGVTMSVVTIQGTDCKLVHLGKLADKTGGQVNIVDPLKLQEEFSNVLADPIIATKVKATFLLYKDLYVCDESDPDSQLCRAEQSVGNVTSGSVITFQFARRQKSDQAEGSGDDQKDASEVKEDEKKQLNHFSDAVEELSSKESSEAAPCTNNCSEKPSSDLNDHSNLPFQLQIEYTDTEGNKALRVLTRSMPVTAERTKAEKNVNLDVLGVHAARMTSDLALRGDYTTSRSVALMNQRLAWRHSNTSGSREAQDKYKNIFGKLKNVENMVQQQQMKEISRRGVTYSDGDDDSDLDVEVNYMPTSQTLRSNEEVADCGQDVADGACLPPSDAKRFKGTVAKKFAAAKKRLTKKKAKTKTDRSKEMGDDMAKMMFQFRSVGSNISSSSVTTGSKSLTSADSGNQAAGTSAGEKKL